MAATPDNQKKFYQAYENMRRKRHGYHNPRNGLVDELLNTYRADYENHPFRRLSVEERYRKYLNHIDGVNAEIQKVLERRKELVQKDDLALQRSEMRIGKEQAFRKHNYLKSAPIKRRPFKKVHSKKTFEQQFDYLVSLEKFVRGIFYRRLNEHEEDDYIYGDLIFGNTDEWLYGDGCYSKEEQYQRKIVQITIGQPGTAQSKKKDALKAFSKFAHEALNYMECFLYFLERHKIQKSKNKYLPLAKVLAGEDVRIQSGEDADNSCRQLVEHYCNKDVVSRLGHIMRYLEDNNVLPADVDAVFKKLGGMTGIIAAAKCPSSNKVGLFSVCDKVMFRSFVEFNRPWLCGASFCA